MFCFTFTFRWVWEKKIVIGVQFYWEMAMALYLCACTIYGDKAFFPEPIFFILWPRHSISFFAYLSAACVRHVRFYFCYLVASIKMRNGFNFHLQFSMCWYWTHHLFNNFCFCVFSSFTPSSHTRNQIDLLLFPSFIGRLLGSIHLMRISHKVLLILGQKRPYNGIRNPV